MRYEIIGEGAYPALKVALSKGEQLSAESGSLLAMSSGVDVETTTRGGLFNGLKQKFLGGESFFVNHYKATRENTEVYLAPTLPGAIRALELRGRTVFLHSGSYLATCGDVEADPKWKGVKSFFAGSGFFMLKISGHGTLFYNCYGAMHDVTLRNEPFLVDTGHIVLFDEGLSYSITTFGGVKSFFFSGEGLVAEFSGEGNLVLQTRNEVSLSEWTVSQVRLAAVDKPSMFPKIDTR